MSREEIGRFLVVYDGTSEEVVALHELKSFELSSFREAFDVPDSDPEMLDRYAVGPDDTFFLRNSLDGEISFDFSSKAFFIEALRKD